MTYTPRTDWVDEPSHATPVMAADLKRIESGIAAVETEALAAVASEASTARAAEAAAQAAAISSASSDATTKANAAQTAAIAAAATDATAKAGTAQTAATAAAATDATTKANAAQAYAIQRGNHTGSQAQSTVTNLTADLAAKATATAGGLAGQAQVRRGTTGYGWGQINQVGIYVPDGWGSYARAALLAAKNGTGKCVVNLVGDSLVFGSAASQLRTKSWAGLLRTYLQAATTDGGGGFSTANTGTYGTANGGWTRTGAWTSTYPSVDYGSGPASMVIYGAPNTGATLTATSPTLAGRYVAIYYGTFGTDEPTVGHTSVAWTIDGAAQTAINTQRTDTTGRKVGKTIVDTGTVGPHTVVVTVVGSAAQGYCELFGAAAENTTGTVVNQFGKSGAKSGSFARLANAQDFESPALWSGGANYPGDLHLYVMGANNVNNPTYTTAKQFTRDAGQHLDAVMAGKAGQTDVGIVMPHIGSFDAGTSVDAATANDGYAATVAAAKGLADAYGAAFINLWALGHNSWSWMNALGNWGNTGVLTGATGTDAVHPSDTGHQWWFNQMQPVIDLLLTPAV